MSLGPVLARPAKANAYQDAYIKRVADSFARVTGAALPRSSGPGVWRGEFALLTHRGDADVTIWRLLDQKLEPFGVGAFFTTVR